ncbi:MAG TPA: hypothetical protein VK099_04460 [Alcanivoracaceae bacterium]|nr:hypothetical protein [Alcanivoracaceae bacterium]
MIIKSKIQNMFRAAALLAPAFLLAACLGVDGDEGITFGSVEVVVKNFPEPACTATVEITYPSIEEEEPENGEATEPTEPVVPVKEELSIPCDELDTLVQEVESEDGEIEKISEEYSESAELKAILGQHTEVLAFTADLFVEEDQVTQTFPQVVQNNKNYTVKLEGAEDCVFVENDARTITAQKADKTFVVDCTEDEDADNDNEEDEIVEEDEVDEESDGE